MTTALFVFNLIAAFGLLAFGAWITYKGVCFVLAKYDWKLAQPGDRRALSRTTSTFSVNQMLTSLNKIIDPAVNLEPLRAEPREGAEEEPDDDEEEDDSNQEPDAGDTADEAKGSTLEGVAKIIEALPNLLKADFGPIVVVCFTGIVVMAGGFYLLVVVLNAAP